MFLRSLSLGVVFALAVVVTPAVASTIVVDAANGPGTNFTDIAAAITAAQPNDLILVRPGAYAPFTVDKALVILATTDNAATTSSFSVQNTVLLDRVVIGGVRPDTANVTGCSGTVVLQRMNNVRQLNVANSRDVRLDTLQIQPLAATPSVDAVVATGSRIEVANCTIRGGEGVGDHGYGGNGVVATNARVHVAGGAVYGGHGADVFSQSLFAGGGGLGIQLAGSASLCMTHATAVAGFGGVNWGFLDDCNADGFPGLALDLAPTSGPNRFSVTFVTNHPTVTGDHCHIAIPAPPAFNGPWFLPAEQDPQLVLNTAPIAGTLQTFRVIGTRGTRAFFWLSREDTLIAGAPGEVELLAPHSRFFRLGTVPLSGFIDFSVFLPATIPQGTVFVAQAETLPLMGPAQRSNSTVLVVR